ncbi:hypothetical protein [Catenuloplanes japonicus]|uniref:hypothetical protein n=1 Tax=Catenuloplanes japonicus TaxID=33876 RepID=UPI000527ECBF|nr:hypothetical protein [Catenuloplanes japonicus]
MGYPPIAQPFYYNAANNPNDPLVNQPGAGLSGWFALIMATLNRSRRSVFSIILATQVLPALAFLLLAAALEFATSAGESGDAQPFLDISSGMAVGGLVLTFVLSLELIRWQAVGWAGGTWAVTTEAATGRDVGLGAAIRSGLSRGKERFGFFLPAGLLTLPAAAFGLVAITITYAERRARWAPVTTPQPAARLGGERSRDYGPCLHSHGQSAKKGSGTR